MKEFAILIISIMGLGFLVARIERIWAHGRVTKIRKEPSFGIDKKEL